MTRFSLIFILVSSLILANGKPTLIDKQIMELSLNYDFDKADKLLEETYTTDKSLKYHYLYLNVELVKSIQAAENIPFEKRQAVKDSVNQILVNYSEKVIEEYEDKELNIDDQFYLGSIYGLLGRAYGVQRSWMSAFSNGKEGKNILEDVIEKDPNYVDAFLLLGMMNYYSDRMGGVTEFLAGILGLSGDRKIGLNYLEKVEKNGTLNNWQATMILIELYSRLENNKFASLPLLEKMVKKFPNNTQFVNWYCYDLINLHKLNEVQKIIENPIYNINDFIKATFLNAKGEYVKSNELFNKIINEKNFAYPGVSENAKYMIALNYFMLGNYEKIKNNKNELRENYLERIDELLDEPELNKQLIQFKNNVQFDNYNEIQKFSKSLPDFHKLKSAEGDYYFYLAVSYFKQNKYLDAAENFIKAQEISFDDFGFSSSRYLIQIYKLQKVDKIKVEKLLDDIDELDNESLEYSAKDLEEMYDL